MNRLGRMLAALVAAACQLAACSGDDSDDVSSSAVESSALTSTTTTTTAASAGCESGRPTEPGTSDRTMTSGGVERVFQLIVPERYDGATPLPIVFGLHALTVNYAFVPVNAGFPEMAQKYDFIAVAPSGRLNGTTPYWVAAPYPDNDDVAFISDLLDLLERDLCVDMARVYSTGMSNGGQMSSVLACQLSDRVTAVAPIAGVEFYEECDGEPVPVMAFHGTDDPIVTYDGGGLNATRIADLNQWDGNIPVGLPEHHGVDAAMQAWANHNGCNTEPIEERVSPDVRKRTWSACDAPTILYIVDGGGHAWPGKPVPGFEESFGYTTIDIDATELMFEFFFELPAA